VKVPSSSAIIVNFVNMYSYSSVVFYCTIRNKVSTPFQGADSQKLISYINPMENILPLIPWTGEVHSAEMRNAKNSTRKRNLKSK
jgi:hypothetical protein